MAIINKETIISAFDDKMTLLQWLKKLEKVLDTSTLTNIKTIKVANTQYKIVLEFEDGTKFESEIIQLQSEIAGIQLDNGHLIFTLMNGETIDAGLIDVSNLGNTTIYGTFEVADGDATFGANVEVDGTLKVNSTLQVGDTTTNDDELAKLPRTLLTPIDTPSEQKLVGIDTANGQNLLNLGQGLEIEGDDVRVGGIIHANEIIENMTGYSYEPKTLTNATFNYKYVGVVKNGNKLTVVIAGVLNTSVPDNVYTLGLFTIPTDVGAKLYPLNTANQIAFIQTTANIDYFNSVNVHGVFVKSSDRYFDFRLYPKNVEANTDYLVRIEQTFLLSDSLVG